MILMTFWFDATARIFAPSLATRISPQKKRASRSVGEARHLSFRRVGQLGLIATVELPRRAYLLFRAIFAPQAVGTACNKNAVRTTHDRHNCRRRAGADAFGIAAGDHRTVCSEHSHANERTARRA